MDEIKAARRKKMVAEKYSIDHKDEMIIKQICLHPAISLRELGELVGLSKTAVSKRMSKPEFKRVLQEKQETTSDSIKKLVQLSCARLKVILEGDDHKLALEAAKLALSMYANLESKSDNKTQEITYAVRFGEQGQMYREIKYGEKDTNQYPTTLDLMTS